MRTIRSTIVIGGLSATIALAALTGCQSTAHKSNQRTADRVFDDKKITSDIRAKLKTEPIYKFDSVEVSTVEGAVRLSGLVSHPEQQRRAEEIARSTLGVKDVLNGLVLKPEGTPTGAEYTTGKLFSEPPANHNSSQQNP